MFFYIILYCAILYLAPTWASDPALSAAYPGAVLEGLPEIDDEAAREDRSPSLSEINVALKGVPSKEDLGFHYSPKGPMYLTLGYLGFPY